jgi:hypothetical protein
MSSERTIVGGNATEDKQSVPMQNRPGIETRGDRAVSVRTGVV